MADGLLSQADIDALIQGQPERKTASPKAKVQPVTDSDSPSPTVSQPPAKAPSVQQGGTKPPEDAIQPHQNREPTAADNSLEDRILNLEKRLSQLEKLPGNLEQLEKKLVASSNASQMSPQQLQIVLQRIKELSQEVSNISNKLKGTLGYGAYQTFKCDKCSSQGHVATVLKCTQCGHESWRGWWPKK